MEPKMTYREVDFQQFRIDLFAINKVYINPYGGNYEKTYFFTNVLNISSNTCSLWKQQ